MAKPTRTCGYSLIELLVVLSILGILTATLVTFSANRQASAVKGIAGDLSGLLRDAQTFARVSGQDVYIASAGSGRAQTIRFGTYPPDKDGNTDFSEPMRVQGSFSIGPQVETYARVDISGDDYKKVAPAKDILKAINGQNYVDADASSLLPADPSDSGTRFFFQSNGNLNKAFYCAVVGIRNDIAYTSAPVAVISGIPGTGVRGYYLADGASGIWRVM